MFRFVFLALVGFFSLFFTSSTLAQIEFNRDDAIAHKRFSATGFPDYPPFGYVAENHNLNYFDSALSPLLKDYANNFNFDVSYIYDLPYQQNLSKVLIGGIDVVLGVYADADPHNALELVYPSILSNPIVVVSLPDKIADIKTIDDLKNLKGAIGSYEYLSEFVKRQLEQYHIQQISSPYMLYKGLYNGDFDYVLASAYNGRIVLAQLGLTGQLSISKNAIWNIPLFIGISKLSNHRGQIRRGLTKISENPESKQKVLNYISEIIQDAENKNRGVVAPDFFQDK